MKTLLLGREVKINEDSFEMYWDKENYRGGQIGRIVSVYGNSYGMSTYTILFSDNKMKDFMNKDFELIPLKPKVKDGCPRNHKEV